jgi:hypothetical protein
MSILKQSKYGEIATIKTKIKMGDDFWEFSATKGEFHRNRKANNAKRNISFLKNSGIEYEETTTPNVVMLNQEGKKAFASLISGYNEPFKVRYEGSSVWHTYNRKELKEKFKTNEK